MNRVMLPVILAWAAASATGCGPGGGIYFPDAGGDGDVGDGDVGDGDWSDAGCRFDTECDDAVDCTDDTCDRSTGLCEHTPDHQGCWDESQCNGYEYCDALLGCQPGIPYQGCNDHNPCTVDTCTEATEPELDPTCAHSPMDRDRDGHVDDHCPQDPIGDPEGPRGTDCDDLDPNRFPGVGEFCSDGVDNDCDALTDDDDDDCELNNDGCETPTVLRPGIVREGFTIGAAPDVDISCGWSSYADVVYSFELTERSDVTIEVRGRDYWYPTVAVQTECGERTSEVACLSGDTTARFFKRGLEPDTYFVVVEGWEEGVFEIILTVAPPTEPPVGDSCSNPLPIEDGDSVTIDLSTFEGGIDVSCAYGDSYPDVVFELELDEAQDVRYEVNGRGLWPYVALQTACGNSGTDLSCASANPQERSLCALEAGTYYLVVRGSEAGEVDVSLDLSEPSTPPANDDCEEPEPIEAAGVYEGSLLCSEADYAPSCRWWSTVYDVVYELTLEEAQDVELSLTGPSGLWPTLVLQTACGESTSELACVYDDAPYVHVRSLAPDTYYVLVQGEFQADYELTVAFSAPTSACDGATVVTESSTLSGDTGSRENDFRATCGGGARGPDRVYQLEIPYDFDITAEATEAEFDTVLHLRSACDDALTELACDDNGGSWPLSLMTASGLAAGTYYLIVDGYGEWNYGSYTVEVEIAPRSPCLESVSVTESGTQSGDTCGPPSVHEGDCGGADAPEDVYEVTLGSAGDLSADLTASGFDGVLYVRTVCDDPESQLGCEASDGPIDLSGLSAGTYYLLVDGLAEGDCGTYDLSITIP